jgi:hypothetical protein
MIPKGLQLAPFVVLEVSQFAGEEQDVREFRQGAKGMIQKATKLAGPSA